jgi:hypothetical protein
MSKTPSVMTSGDCLVVKRTDGLFEVYKVWAGGARQPVSDSIADRRAAWRLASTLLTPDGETVYFKEAGEPDSAIRPHPAQEEQLLIAYA